MEAILLPGLQNAHLVLLGFGDRRDAYRAAADESRYERRVHVLDPVPPDELLPWIASADVGAMPIQPSTLNHYLSTPNKLFECLAAGIPVVASDFPTTRRIVVDNPTGPLGAVCDPSSAESLAGALRSILELGDPRATALRARCLAAAHERWNWETESAGLTRLYGDLAGIGSLIEGPTAGSLP
jgi:glycosyltransferase involved in cell wall biosynthesis